MAREGLEALLSQGTGHPPVTPQSEVVQAVIEERRRPADAEIAARANQHLNQTGYDDVSVTERMAQTIRLAWEIKRPATQKALSLAPDQEQEKMEAADETISLGYTRWGGAFVLLDLLIQEAWLAYADLLPMAPDYAVTPEHLLLTAIFAPIWGISRAFQLDDVRDVGFALLTLRIRRGAKQLHRAVPPMTREILRQWKSEEGIWRLFLARGAFQGLLFQTLKLLPRGHFYLPTGRYSNYVEAGEKLPESTFEEAPFVFARAKDRPPEERISYRLADSPQEVNLWEGGKLRGTVTLRAIILFNPQGETTSKRWFVLLTDDRDTPARELANEYGDHWEHEMAHRVGKHDLDYDIRPPSYMRETHRDPEDNLMRDAKLDIGCSVRQEVRRYAIEKVHPSPRSALRERG